LFKRIGLKFIQFFQVFNIIVRKNKEEMLIMCKTLHFLAGLILVIGGCGNHYIMVSFDADNEQDPAGESPGDLPDTAYCFTDEDCSNGFVCDGVEKCLDSRCVAGTPMICDDGNDCTIDSCSEEAWGCVFIARDADGDGFGDAACGGTDCDDTRDDVYPEAPESCEPGEDLDCSGTPDIDNDNDGYLDAVCPGGDDCDDNDANAYPGAPEICLDGIDQDCDGIVDGPMLMSSNVKITDYGSDSLSMVWTGSEFGIARNGIHFTRVSADGVEIGYEEVVTPTHCYSPPYGCYSSVQPSMVWTGNEFTIAYKGRRSVVGWDIYFIRLNSRGANVGVEMRLTFAEGSYYKMTPGLAWTGSQLGMVWHHSTPDPDVFTHYNDIYFKQFYQLGADATEEIILNDHEDGWNPQLTWTGSEFGVIWNCEGICFSRVSAGGTVLGDKIQLTPLDYAGSYIHNPVWTGSEYGIAWEDYRVEGGTTQVYFARISSDGMKENDDILLSDSMHSSRNPDLAWTGSEFGIVWVGRQERSDVDFKLFFNHLTPAGTEIGSEIALTEATSGNRFPLDLVWTGSEFGVVWKWTPYDSRNGTYFNRIGFCD